MPIQSFVVNEGTPEFERYAVKIAIHAGIHQDEFIKTFPFYYSARNTSVLSLMKEELPPFKKRSYLGIGFTSYPYNNYIQFYSTYKSFPLKKGDKIILHFEDKVKMELKFFYANKSVGFLSSNVCAIKDADLAFLSENKLLSWQMVNEEKSITLHGGFMYHEGNKQYVSEKTGQNMFRKMAQHILTSKNDVFTSQPKLPRYKAGA